MASSTVIDRFSPAVREWFTTTFPEPTPAQAQGWPAISSGEHSLILAPTGSGKTLAAFLWGIDRLVSEPAADDGLTRILYISPLRALAVDVDKNLRSPLQGIALAARRLGVDAYAPTVGVRTGDTPANERRLLVRNPPDILITTPESLYLMLTSRARETLAGVRHVIIDEIHALAPTKRGAHLSLSLERLEELGARSGKTGRPPQRIGLSATQRPLDVIAGFLGGRDGGEARPVTVVDAGLGKELDIEVVVPVDDMGALGDVVDEPATGPAGPQPARRSIWPAMHPRLLELVQSHRSTLIFVNSRRLAERLATKLNELAAETERGDEPLDPAAVPELVKAHHGSISRERRLLIEDELKRGALRGLVCTSSLELGIDMGAVDLVIQVSSPGAVARGLQRIGRAGHQVGEPSRGRIFPKHRSDLLEATVVVDRMKQGLIEATRYPRNPLDVLCQQIVAMTAMDDWPVAELAALVRRSGNFAELSDDVLRNVLDLLAGRYPSEEFSELRPRIVWDRVADVVRGRAGAQRLAVTSGGTIPDRGLFGVFLPDGTRVGELDEEMVYESRPGDTFLLGASTWRIEDITFERVVVTPAPGEPGRMPFWHGDGPGRPLELGQAMGEFVRELRGAEGAVDRLQAQLGLDERAATNLVGYLHEQAEATGAVPDDRTIVVERFRDEIGDWRVCVLSPFGAQVHAPWGMALQGRLADRWGPEVELMWSDDGIVLRLPEAVDELPLDELMIDPAEIDELVLRQLPNTALFAARFRECAGRALLLPRRRPDRRTPLWQQRQRSADLLGVASGYPDFPILLETTRECLNDVFDLGALRQVLTDLRGRRIRLVGVESDRASPFAQSLLFGWIAVYMYEGDAPLAERRAAALALDRDLLRELLGAEELRELLDADVLAHLELELQSLVDGRRARDADDVHDLLRRLGPLTGPEIAARSIDGLAVDEVLAALHEERRAMPVSVAAELRWAAAEDASRLRDALGVALPVGLPGAFTDPVERPLHDLALRFARTHGPFPTSHPARWLGLAIDDLTAVLADLEGEGLLVRGEFRPDGVEREWCEPEVLRRLRRRSLAALRREVEPVDGAALARFLSGWHGIGSRRRGVDAVAEVLGQLQGAALPASVLETDLLPARIESYRESDLDELCTSGEVVWVGAGSLGATDGRVRLVFRDQVSRLVPDPLTIEPVSNAPASAAPGSTDSASTAPASTDSVSVGTVDLHGVLRDHLGRQGASFWPELVAAAAEAGLDYDQDSVLSGLWDLVWAGEVTNDSLAPVRALRQRRGRRAAGSRRRPGRLSRLGPPTAVGRWSLVAPRRVPAVTETEIAHARALQLLERYGLLTREMALGEGLQGGFAGVYPVLKALEEQGKVRRGYFVAGLGAAQFALAGAVDRLRDHRDRSGVGDGASEVGGEGELLAATDPAQPYGSSLPWPETAGRPGRVAGAYVVLVAGELAAYLEKGARSLATFPAARAGDRWAEALAIPVKDGRLRSVDLARIDGEAAADSPVVPALLAAGFVRSYRGFTLRA